MWGKNKLRYGRKNHCLWNLWPKVWRALYLGVIPEVQKSDRLSLWRLFRGQELGFLVVSFISGKICNDSLFSSPSQFRVPVLYSLASEKEALPHPLPSPAPTAATGKHLPWKPSWFLCSRWCSNAKAERKKLVTNAQNMDISPNHTRDWEVL